MVANEIWAKDFKSEVRSDLGCSIHSLLEEDEDLPSSRDQKNLSPLDLSASLQLKTEM